MGPTRVKMLAGFNHNIKFQGKTFHIQTEDGGKANPIIKTHVFIGGIILDSVHSSYEDILGHRSWRDILKRRMKVQHLEEIRRLFSGEINSVEDQPYDQ